MYFHNLCNDKEFPGALGVFAPARLAISGYEFEGPIGRCQRLGERDKRSYEPEDLVFKFSYAPLS